VKNSAEPFNPLKRTGLKPRMLWLSVRIVDGVRQIEGGTYRRTMGALPTRSLSAKDKRGIRKLAEAAAMAAKQSRGLTP
jgi:hypothetical protein